MTREMPERVRVMRDCGYATWAGDKLPQELRSKFHQDRIPVKSVRHVRVWGLQVDDERELPGHERTQIPDEDLWEVCLEALDGSSYSFDSGLLEPAGGPPV